MNYIKTEWKVSENEPKNMQKLLSFNENQLIQIQLLAGKEISTHKAGTDALIIVRKGKVQFTVEGKEIVITNHDILYLEPDENHSIIALEDTELLLVKIR
ncbi:cupin domain-containing protein [Bacillus aquiflavi]|uniref:Cupin domain-containing protein n=1 Tax=Bacillus aquiflavi TaxID=2672567 RepID=A0A6B3VZH8_9BACI|nr:cupin domain-containing protein [Bacillus aquiflavi]MBA4536962.1 cupin domain-containing protein [Bacillus aquiflavi]NEY82658.1 cupin domain-containing protein [Bacillus aquiflavi]UAC47777.1 cupin domain-containing protein [Bacillus aquiflavi]